MNMNYPNLNTVIDCAAITSCTFLGAGAGFLCGIHANLGNTSATFAALFAAGITMTVTIVPYWKHRNWLAAKRYSELHSRQIPQQRS